MGDNDLASVHPSVCVSVRPSILPSVRKNISNEYFFPILYTCIYNNPPMNPVKFRQDKIQNVRLIAIFVCSNWQNIWKYCPSRWISPTPMNIGFQYYTFALTTILPWILWSFVRITFKMDISNTNEYLFPILYTCIYYNPPITYNLQQFLPVGGYRISDILVIYNYQQIFVWIFVC